MATGVRRLHGKSCPGKRGGRCRCKAGWEAYIWSGVHERQLSKTFKRRAEAISWRASAKAALDSGTLQVGTPDQVTLGEALDDFVEGMASGRYRPKGKLRYKPNTIRSYETAVRVHIVEAPIARKKVGALRRRDVQDFADGLLERGLAAGTVSNILNPVQAYYRVQIQNENLSMSPAAGINVAYGKTKRPRRIVSAAEAPRLLAALDVSDRALWAAAFYAGLRRGELQALRVCDLDMADKLISVEYGWDPKEGEITPKSEAGVRMLPMLGVLQGYLEDHLRQSGRSGEDRVFGRDDGRPFDPSTVNNRGNRAWKRWNERESERAKEEGREPNLLFPLTMHECRHTFASLLIDAGTNAKAIQTYMGHEKITTTFDTYGHLMEGRADEDRRRVDAYLAGKEQRSGELSRRVAGPDRSAC